MSSKLSIEAAPEVVLWQMLEGTVQQKIDSPSDDLQ